MAIEIPEFDSVVDKIEWLRAKTVELSQPAANPALEADRDALGPILLAAIAEATEAGLYSEPDPTSVPQPDEVVVRDN